MKELIDQFDLVGGLVHAWWNAGWRLLTSADILSREWHPGVLTSPARELTEAVHGPRLLLRGCGVECQLKAIYVSNGGVLAADGRYISPGGRSHDLVNLAKAARLQLNPDEQFLLRQLSFWVERGRYPIATSWARELIDTPQGPVIGQMWDSERDEAAFNAFRNRLQQIGQEMAEKAERERPGERS